MKVGRICPHCRQHVGADERHTCMSETQVIRRRVYDDPRWRRTRVKVMKRDGYRCRICHDEVGPFLCDHSPVPLVDLVELGRDPFDPAACRTLCLTCSGAVDGPRAAFSRENGAHAERRLMSENDSPIATD